MKILLLMVVVQSLNLVVFAWLDRVAFMQILTLRQQLCVYQRKLKPPKLRNRDRLFWSLISRLWRDWRAELIFVKPETVIRWRERKFREFWRRKSQNRPGRPTIPNEHIDFIRRISSDHPEYGGIASKRLFLVAPHGLSSTPFKTNRCLWSKLELPRSSLAFWLS